MAMHSLTHTFLVPIVACLLCSPNFTIAGSTTWCINMRLKVCTHENDKARNCAVRVSSTCVFSMENTVLAFDAVCL